MIILFLTQILNFLCNGMGPDFDDMSSFFSRRLRCAGHVARMEEGSSAFKILTGKAIGKRPLGRPRRR